MSSTCAVPVLPGAGTFLRPSNHRRRQRRADLRRVVAAAATAVLAAAGLQAVHFVGADVLHTVALDAGSVPHQRQGSAAGRAHLVGHNGNHVVPTTVRGRYPLNVGTASAARTVSSPAATGQGYDRTTSVEITDRRTARSSTFRNTDGSLTTVVSAGALNYRDPDGHWQPVRPTLRPTGSGSVVSAGGAAPLELAGVAGPTALASLGLGDGLRAGWSLLGAHAARARVSAATAIYPAVLPGTDLELTSQPNGVKETLVLRKASALSTYSFRLSLAGLTARTSGRQVLLVDRTGVTRGIIPAGSMLDAAGGYSDAVSYTVTGSTLVVRADPAWLHSPGRHFPVRLDPTVLSTAAGAALTAQDSGAYAGGSDFQVGAHGGTRSAAYLAFPSISGQLANETVYGAKLSVVDYDAGSCAPRAVAVYPVTQSWSAGDTSLKYPGPSVGKALASESYAYGHVSVGQTATSCPVRSTLYDLGARGRDLVQGWANGSANYGLSLRAASPDDAAAWKKFAGTGTANPPTLYITHSPYNATYSIPKPVLNPPVLQNSDGKISVVVTNKGARTWTPSTYYLAYRVSDSSGKVIAQQRAADLPGSVARNARVTLTATVKQMPVGKYTLDFTMVHVGGPVFTDDWVPPARLVLQVFNVPPVPQSVYPPNGYSAATLTPQLWAAAIDKDAPTSSLTYNFSICATGGTCFTSGYQSALTWTVPTGDLQWNQTYTWHADVKDSNQKVVATPTLTLLTPVPQPDVTGHLGAAPYADRQTDFDPLTGNYTTGAVDASVPTAGPELSVSRVYNSLDPRTDSAFGAGWSTVYDMRLTSELDGNVLVTFPDGQQVRFGRNPDGTYVAPADRQVQLTNSNGSWSLRDVSGTVYSMSSTGRLARITGGWGDSIVLTYDTGGHVATATDLAGHRALHFTWSAGHVSTVTTDPVGGATPTWSYTYSSNRLASVCDPGNACTTYAAATGSHYRTAVVNDQPDSFWRLGEPAGSSTAASQMAVNLGADAATYVNTTSGGTGALAGTDDTSTAFNGTSGYVGLPDGIAKRNRDLAIELWFRTTATTANPLIGYEDKAWGSTPTAGVPVLYVGTDGKLRGQFANGKITPITSSNTVNNGAWHHVVVSNDGGTTTLYLDGTAVGTLTGTVNQTTLTHTQIGAATVTGTWPGYGTGKAFFSGSIDDAAVYSHPLPASSVITHRALGIAASSELTAITLPTGNTAAEITYDTALDRIAGYTDGNGGNWKLGAPTVAGGDTDLRTTVEARDPADRPYQWEYDALGGWLTRQASPTGRVTRPEDRSGPPTSPTPPTQPNCPTPDPGDPSFCTWSTSSPPATAVFDTEGMSVRSYNYNALGQLIGTVDENGDTVALGYDGRGNLTDRTTCRTSATDCNTTRYTFPTTGLSDPLDPRWTLPTAVRDPRSASSTDNSFRTAYSYTNHGDVTAQTNADGSSVRYTYTNGSEVAVGGGVPPAGLVSTMVDRLGSTTTYSYYASGDLAQTTAPSGLVDKYTYDPLGRLTGHTEVSNSYPSGVTTTYGYDATSRLTSTTYPVTTDAVTGDKHQRRTTLTYDADGNVLTSTETDLQASVTARVTTMTYDDHDRLASVTDPLGDEQDWDHDVFGNVTAMVDANGNRFTYAYTARNDITEVRLDDADSTGSTGYTVLASAAYDYAGHLAQRTDADGVTTEWTYNHDGTVSAQTITGFHNADGSTRDYVLARNTYDAAGNPTKVISANGTRTSTYTYDAMNRMKSSLDDPGGVARSATYGYDTAGDLTSVTSSANASNVPWATSAQRRLVTTTYDASGWPTSSTLTLNSTQTARASTVYDQRGLAVSVVDPRGNVTGASPAAFTTDYRFDELGNPVTVTGAPVAAEHDGGQPSAVRPVVSTGYDAFGEPTSTKDPLGGVVTTAYDAAGRVVRRSAPTYTAPGATSSVTPSATTTYDANGNAIGRVDPLGNTTRYRYDRQDRLVATDAPSATDADRVIARTAYSRGGRVLSSTDPTGAVTSYTYDDLSRPVTTTSQERIPQAANLTTRLTYDDAGDLSAIVSPSGSRTTATYDSVGQLTAVTAASGVINRFGWDGQGHQVRRSDGLGRTTRTAFDDGGRAVQVSNLDPAGNILRSSTSTYDVDGNVATQTDPTGAVSSFTYDAAGRLSSQSQPIAAGQSITTGFGYDAAGDRTRFTDGRGDATFYTFNALGLPESVIDPATTADPAAGDRTWTTSYDAAGQPVKVVAPGGVTTLSAFDAAGRLTGQDGSGGGATSASRRLGYDADGRLASAGTPSGTDTYRYDDRGHLVSASGPSGAVDAVYDEDGNLTKRVDAAGTAQFAYIADRLSSQTDPVTGATQTMSYDASGALRTVAVPAGLTTTMTYDDLGRLSKQALSNGAGSEVTATAYSYDLDDRITGRSTSGVAGSGTQGYRYDQAGRMTAWTAGSATVEYTWDAAGNRTKAGAITATYDQRNRLLAAGGTTYAYTSRGTLASQSTASTTTRFGFDAFDRMTADGTSSYSYDDLDRLASIGSGASTRYDGASPAVVTDGTQVVGRSADGSVLSVGQNDTKRLTVTDAHGDVTGGYDPTNGSATALPDSRTFDPWGNTTASTGTAYHVGFQSALTDPATGKVDMSARWYDPGSGTFTARDTVDTSGGGVSAANRYAYAAGDPATLTDPSGHSPCGTDPRMFLAAPTSSCPPAGGGVAGGIAGGIGGAIGGGESGSFGGDPAESPGSLGCAVFGDCGGGSGAGNGSSAGNGSGGSGGSGGSSGPSAAQLAHQQAVAAQQRALAGIANRAKHVALPPPSAATRPAGEGRVVSSSPNLPARVVSQTSNGVQDNRAGTQRVYQDVVNRTGPITQQTPPAVALDDNSSCGGTGGVTNGLPNYHPDPAHPGNSGTPLDDQGGCSSTAPVGPGGAGNGGAGKDGSGKPKTQYPWPKLSGDALDAARQKCMQGHDVTACDNYFANTKCKSLIGTDDPMGVCLMRAREPYVPPAKGDPINPHPDLPGSGDDSGGGGGWPDWLTGEPPEWLIYAAVAAVVIVGVAAICLLGGEEICAAAALGSEEGGPFLGSLETLLDKVAELGAGLEHLDIGTLGSAQLDILGTLLRELGSGGIWRRLLTKNPFLPIP